MPDNSANLPRIVSTVMLMADDLIVVGVRHFSPDMRAVLHRVYGSGAHLKVKDQGFIDSQGQFLNRKLAWDRAIITGQIIKDCHCQGTLYSENLY